MTFRDLIPWSKNQPAVRQPDDNPFLTLHREMNRLFDDVFRGFDLAGPSRLLEGRFGWPNLELSETEKDVKIAVELPGLSEKDVQVEIANGVLSIRGERKEERNDNGRFFSERFYGSFARQIPLEGVQEDKAQADFHNGVLTIVLPKSENAQQNVKRVPINAH